MRSLVAGTVFLILDLAAIIGAGIFASWAANRDLPGIVKSGIGALCGLVVEAVRIGVVYLVMKVLYAEATPPSGFVAFLASFRILNIPILVGIGFLAGSVAGQTNVKCPACGKPVLVNASDVKEPAHKGISIAPPAAEPKLHRQECPHCRATLVLDAKTLAVVGHEPGEERANPAPPSGSSGTGSAV